MQTDYIIVNEYSQQANLEPTFFILLEEYDLIDIQVIEGEKRFPSTQLADLERYTRMYYDLSINIEGIDAIHHILDRIKNLQNEINFLRNRLSIYETGDSEQ